MTITGWLYIVEVVSNIDFMLGMFFAIITLSLAILAIITTFTIDNDELFEMMKINWRWVYKKLWIYISIILISVLFPSSKTMYLMLGTSYLHSSDIPMKVKQALELKLDDVINELKNNSKEKK